MPLDPDLQELTTARQSIISYDWVDNADGTGFVGYYLFSTEDNSDKNYHLGRNAVYSAVTEVVDGTGEDFDLTTFNKARIIKGTAQIQIPFNVWGSGTRTQYLTVTLKNGATSIVSVQTKTIIAATATVQGVHGLKLVIPETFFAAGDVLRLTIVPTRTGLGWDRYGIDPMNRQGANTNPITQSRIFIPFKIDN